MHQVIYNNKLEHKYTLTPFDPRLLYIGPIQAKGHLSIRETCPDLYICLFVLCVIFQAACSAAEHPSVLCSIKQLPNAHYAVLGIFQQALLSFCIEYIVFILFCDHTYQNYIAS